MAKSGFYEVYFSGIGILCETVIDGLFSIIRMMEMAILQQVMRQAVAKATALVRVPLFGFRAMELLTSLDYQGAMIWICSKQT